MAIDISKLKGFEKVQKMACYRPELVEKVLEEESEKIMERSKKRVTR